MATTKKFQVNPDYYNNQSDCLNHNKNKVQTNPRYKFYHQTHLTIGDEQQFQEYRDATNSQTCIPDISLNNNLFRDQPFEEWPKFKNVRANAVIDTFRYMFNKFGKGIFVKIVDNKLQAYLPFSKHKFKNEWSGQVRVDPAQFSDINDFLRHISKMNGFTFNPRRINSNIDEWYGNDCLVRYEYPPSQSETNVANLKNMLETLCATRKLPDMEFFINRRDFPVITKNGTEPYINMWGTDKKPLISHDYKKYIPILSMSKTDHFADVLMILWEDWIRVSSMEGKFFPNMCRIYNDEFKTEWKDKTPTAIFRGASTGCGVTIDSNPRLKVSYISTLGEKDTDGILYIDAGITKWNLRPRKNINDPYMRTIDIKKLPFDLVKPLTPEEQSKYKYLINVDGHVTAYRLSLELSMGSVILKVKSKWKIWYSDMLIPYTHYVPVREDMSDLIDRIRWCKANDSKCEQIAKNARSFYEKYLRKEGLLDYMQKTLIDIKEEMGVYLYNESTPLQEQIRKEKRYVLTPYYPKTTKTIGDISETPVMHRCSGLLQGIQWLTNFVIDKDDFENIATKKTQIFKNKLGTVSKCYLGQNEITIKTTSDLFKIQEHIHESFVGKYCINILMKYIPNFAYMYGLYQKGDSYNVVLEYIPGQTLSDYISSKTFSFHRYLFITIQICLALQVAQNHMAFVHNDLTPWNIILHYPKETVTVDYVLDAKTVVRVRTNVIPVIIDYGKSHVVHNEEHHGFINMYKSSSYQDIFTYLITTLTQISTDKFMSKSDFSAMLTLANFMTGGDFYPRRLNDSRSLKQFLRDNATYSNLIQSDKKSLELKKPRNLINYIIKIKGYKYDIGKTKTYNPYMNMGNSKQVFDYMLSKTNEERAKSYYNVFKRFEECKKPMPDNLFFIYYTAQYLYFNLNSVYDDMVYFLNTSGTDLQTGEKLWKRVQIMLDRTYGDILRSQEEKLVPYTLDGSYKTLEQALYTEETFLEPSVISGMIKEYENNDLTDYKDIIEMILVCGGKYKLTDEHKELYLKNFDRLLQVNGMIMKNNNANLKTLRVVAKSLYTQNMKFLEASEKCDVVEDYMYLYSEVLDKINTR